MLGVLGGEYVGNVELLVRVAGGRNALGSDLLHGKSVVGSNNAEIVCFNILTPEVGKIIIKGSLYGSNGLVCLDILDKSEAILEIGNGSLVNVVLLCHISVDKQISILTDYVVVGDSVSAAVDLGVCNKYGMYMIVKSL